MNIYCLAYTNASCGVCSSPVTHPVARVINAVQTAAITANSTASVPTARAAFSGSFSPMAWPIITVPPMESPSTAPVMVCIIWLPVATAETAAELS